MPCERSSLRRRRAGPEEWVHTRRAGSQGESTFASVEALGPELVEELLGGAADLGGDAAEGELGARGDGDERFAEGAPAVGEVGVVEEADGVGGVAGAGGLAEEGEGVGPNAL